MDSSHCILFMDKFYWGFAIAATQNEGAYLDDGKSLSNWDAFSSNPKNIEDKTNSFVACDFYHRYKEDVALLKECGVNSFRFSINWARVIPDGRNINDKGIKFYQNLVDELLRNNIEPIITLCHWDMPECLEKQGGWLNRSLIIDAFALFTKAIINALKGKVKYIITFNEPQNIAFSGYNEGHFAPGKHLSKKEVLTVSHNILLAHGTSYRIIKEIDPNIKVSFNNCGWVAIPSDESNKALVKACYNSFFSVEPERIGDGRTMYTDPIMFGDYPKDYYEVYKDFLPDILEGDMDLIHTGMDFASVNIYQGYFMKEVNGNFVRCKENILEEYDNDLYTAKAMYYFLKFYYERYKLPILVSENGADSHDDVILDGKIHDVKRYKEIECFISYMKKAISEGVEVFGYLIWTFMDNFEWSSGYGPRMGLVAVDRNNNLNRIKKDSFYWYRDFIKGEKR